MADNKSVLIELDGAEPLPVADAPVVADQAEPAQGQAMLSVLKFAGKRPSRLARLFWGLLLSLFFTILTVNAYNAVSAMVVATPILGYAVTGLVVLFAGVCVVIALRELWSFSRLRRVDRLQVQTASALADNDVDLARRLAQDLKSLYADRPETAWSRARLDERLPDAFDASTVFSILEQDLMDPLDQQAQAEVEAAARQVALVTTLVPLALADVLTALIANLRMIRRIAEIYSGKSGTLGSWRLTRAVMAHLLTTGAVAVGDDLLGSLAGGSMLGKISRRFGEGVVNGALTARVGVAAIEVCRPLAFSQKTRPSTGKIVKRALAGVFIG